LLFSVPLYQSPSPPPHPSALTMLKLMKKAKKLCFLSSFVANTNILFSMIYLFYGQEYMVSVVNTNILFSMTYLFYGQEYMVSVAPTQTSCFLRLIYSMDRSTWCLLPQHKHLVFYDLYILWTGVHGVCCQHKNRGCGQTTAARVQYAKYYVSIQIILKIWIIN